MGIEEGNNTRQALVEASTDDAIIVNLIGTEGVIEHEFYFASDKADLVWPGIRYWISEGGVRPTWEPYRNASMPPSQEGLYEF